MFKRLKIKWQLFLLGMQEVRLQELKADCRGAQWHSNPAELPRFREELREVRAAMKELKAQLA